MTIENGGEQLANDTAVAAEEKVALTPKDAFTQGDPGADDYQGEEDQGGEDGNGQEPEWAEIDIDGKKYRVEAAAKDGYLRQSDYTKKTMEVADARKALDAEREQFQSHTEVQKAHFQMATKLAALDDQLAPYAKLSPQEWMSLHANDPAAYEQHRVNYDFLKNQRDAVARDFSEKERQRAENENRERGTQVQKVQAEIARLIPEWTPGNEVDLKLTRYGIEQGLSKEDMAHAILRQPKFALALKRLHDYDEAAKKQKTQQTFQKSQEAAPVTRVGGNSGAAARRTTDSSGDALSADAWAKRERDRIAAAAHR